MEIEGCVAFVSGGASGLGEACVRDLLSRGARVCLLDVAQERGEQIASALGGNALFVCGDVSDGGVVEDAVRSAVEAFGTLHVAVNCAGVATPAKVLGRDGPMPLEHFRRVVDINLIGTMNVIRCAAGQMAGNEPNGEGERGVIVNTASVAAFEGQVGQAAYSASKAGVAGMTLPIAREFAGHGIRVVAIAPGLFHTPILAGLPDRAVAALAELVPFPHRLGKPAEFSMLVRHVIENPMLNGTTIRLDAALRMPP